MTAQEYLQQHGINEESIKRFELTWTDTLLNIPIKDPTGKTIWTKQRVLNYNPDKKDMKKYLNATGSTITIFNLNNNIDKSNLILTEGEIDTIRLEQEGIPAVSSTGGAGTFNQELANLLTGKTIYIAYDNDEPGQKGIKKVLDHLPTAKVLELPIDSHDICDYFTKHTKADFVGVLKAALSKEEYNAKHLPQEYSIITGQELYSMEFPEERWLIDKILPATGITMFVGESGVGKSFIATEVVRALIEQDIFLDHFEIKGQAPVLIIDKENGLRRTQKRMRDMGVPASDDIYLLKYPEYFTLETDRTEFLQFISDFIKQKEIKVITLDSFVDIVVGSENDSGDTSKVFNALKSIASDVCWVILHHDSKPMPHSQRTAGQRTRGSSNIIAQVDNQFYIEKMRNSNKVINIEQGKSRDNEPVGKFSVEFISDGLGNMCGFKYLGEITSEASKVDAAADFIMNFIGLNPNQTRQIILEAAEQHDHSKTSIERALSMLKDKKLLKSQPDPTNKSRKLFTILMPEDEQMGLIDD